MATPAWQRVAALMRDRIADGTYPPGSRLPSRSQLAEEHGVSMIVVRRVYLELVHEGLVEGREREGYYVRESGGGPPDSGSQP